MAGPTPRAAFQLLRSQLTIHPQPVKSSFAGQTIIVTGGNTGLGKAAARMLVELQAKRVIITARSIPKGEEAKRDIDATGETVEVWPLDLADNKSILAFSERVNALDRLDAVIENAGMWPTSHTTANGHELTLLTNVISTMLIAHLILPKLTASAQQHNTTSRLTFVGSALHKFATLTARKDSQNLIAALDHVELKSTSDYDSRYNDSKLLVQLYVQRLAESKQGEGVCITVVNPGYCHSGLKPPTDFGTRMFEKLLARSTDEGAYALVDAVASDKVEGRNGKYIDDQTIKSPACWIDTEEGRQTSGRLWNDLNAELKSIVPSLGL